MNPVLSYALVCWFRSDASGDCGKVIPTASTPFPSKDAALAFLARQWESPLFDHAELSTVERFGVA